MNTSNKLNTAILIFALSSQEEQKRKKIENSDHLFHALSEHSLKIVSRTGLPYFHYTEKEQEGSSFGERFTNAIQAVFNKGYGQIITIGNDSPQIKTSHIQRAAMLLSNNKSVIGPSADGGFYLMGLHRDNFNAIKFKELPWQTSRLASQLIKEFSNASYNFVQLERLFDIDNCWDLHIISKFSNQLPYPVKRIIVSLLETTTAIHKAKYLFKKQFQFRVYQNRGSPRIHLA